MNPEVIPYDDPQVPSLVEEALETGKTLIFPTDTVYGIGGNPWDERTLVRVRRLKERPADRPFTLHLPSLEAIGRYASLEPDLLRVVERYLPGPFTLLLPANPEAPAGSVKEGKVGIRVPDHPFFSGVMAGLDRALFGTSVNLAGEEPINDLPTMIERFGRVDLIITGPVTGHPSTIIDITCDPPRIVRDGSASLDRLEPSDEVA